MVALTVLSPVVVKSKFVVPVISEFSFTSLILTFALEFETAIAGLLPVNSSEFRFNVVSFASSKPV